MERTSQTGLPTVRDALALPEVRAGDPEVLTGDGGLDRRIRWAHVVAGAGAVEFLDGGELVLTTGAGWPADEEELARFSDELTGSDPAAIMLELGPTYSEPPGALVEACSAAAVPLLVLRRPVRFVQITQRIHQRILAAQTEALEARSEVHAMLTELGLNRSPVDYVVERLADTLEATVVLEDSAHRVVAWTDRSADDTGHPLSAWASPAEEPRSPLPAGWERVPVEAQGRRWGTLTALPGPAHPAGRRTVLELGAFALALGRLADPDGEQWMQLSSKRLFDALLGGRYRHEGDLATQLAASGLPISGRTLLGATLRITGEFGAHDTLERAIVETALRRSVEPDGRVLVSAESPGDRRSPILVLCSFPRDGEGEPPRAIPSDPGASSPFAARLARELDLLLPSTTPTSWRTHLSLGASGSGIPALITSLEQARAAGVLEPVDTVGRVSVQQAERQPLAYLVRRLAPTPEVQEFARDALEPLIAHDAAQGAGHSGDLLRVLAAYLEHPTNRSLAAQRARLSRSVFYQRIALIEELLGADLSEGITIATLTVALLARR